MKNTINKIFASVLALMLAVSAIPASAENGTFSGGTGTATDPYLLSTAADLIELSTLTRDGTLGKNYVNKHYKLTADIDLEENDDFDGIGWGYPVQFSGTIDGNYHIIKNIKDNKDSFGGFINVTDGATIKNLGIENADLSGSGARGGFVGRTFGATVVDNCYIRGLTINPTDNVNNKGAFFGNESVQNVTLTNSYSSDLKGLNFGIVGNVYGAAQGEYTISNVYSTLSVANIKNGLCIYQLFSAATDEQMEVLGEAFVQDINNINGGFPVLKWENERPSEVGTITASGLSYAVENGTLSGSVTVANYYIEALPLCVCVAVYGENNKMLAAKIYSPDELGIDTETSELASGEKKNLSFSFENAADAERINLFLWDNPQNIKQYSVTE